MVQMHPKTMPAGILRSEQVLFQKFQNLEGHDDWHVFHSLKMHSGTTRAEGEIDFLVLIPGEGQIVIEVKGARGIDVTEDGWEFIGLPESNKTPVEQVDGNRSDLLGYLGKKVGLFPTARAIWVPWLSNEDLSDFDGDLSINRWEILSQDDLGDVAASTLRTVRNYRAATNLELGFRSHEEFVEEAFAKTLDSISQRFRATASARTIAKSLQDELEETEYGFEQIYNLIRRNNNILLEGPAGSGKSGYLRRFALDCYEDPTKDNKVLLLSWGEFVAEHNMSAYSAYPNMDIWDIGALMLEITGLTKADAKNHDNFYTSYLPELAVKMLPESRFGNYDMIAIDEFQDVATRPVVFEFIRALAKRNDFVGTRLILAADPRQQIMRDPGMAPVSDPWGAALALTPNLMHVLLSDNYRNSEDIGIAVEKLAGEAHLYDTYQIENFENSIEIVEVSEGTQPLQLREALRRLRSEFEPANICLLSPYRDESAASLVLNTPNLNPIGEEIRTMLTFNQDEDDKSFATTIQKFKGLESHAVIVTDLILKAKHLEDDKKKRERIALNLELLYVAVSRANRKVVLLCDSHMAAELRSLGL
jgi:Nuclease-related domain/UvrD-like helicase C-terminal domain